MLPAKVIEAATGHVEATVIGCVIKPLGGVGGLATARLELISCTIAVDDAHERVDVVLKELVAPTGSRHDLGARNPRHWAYWRREALAYASGLLPDDPCGLAAPRCLGIAETPEELQIYLPYLEPAPVDLDVAAAHLGRWNARILRGPIPRSGWLAAPPITRRVYDTDRAGGLDWSVLPVAAADRSRLAKLWDKRHHLIAGLGRIPRALVHGDYHLGNLIADGARTYVLDWATLGRAPLGSDLATLSLNLDLPPHDGLFDHYLAELAKAVERDVWCEAQFGYLASTALAGASRLHWALSRGQRLDAAELWIEWLVRIGELALRLPSGVGKLG